MRAARPASPRTTDTANAVVSLCEHRLRHEGREIVYLYEVVRGKEPGRDIAFQQYFDEHLGQPLRLPQDLRMIPPAGAKASARCRAITSSGELADA